MSELHNGYIGEPLKNWIKPDYMVGWFKSDDKLIKHLDDKIVAVHSSYDVSPPFKHRNIHFWVELESGYAVGFNENPSSGWSYPIKRHSN